MLNVVVSSSELAKEVLKKHDQKMEDLHRSRSVAKFNKDGHDVIWADYGPHYVKVRKVCTPFLTFAFSRSCTSKLKAAASSFSTFAPLGF
ncbi:hypothetical protein ACFX2C_006891 [Malus domestica]